MIVQCGLFRKPTTVTPSPGSGTGNLRSRTVAVSHRRASRRPPPGYAETLAMPTLHGTPIDAVTLQPDISQVDFPLCTAHALIWPRVGSYPVICGCSVLLRKLRV
jgi:hypothetical protein